MATEETPPSTPVTPHVAVTPPPSHHSAWRTRGIIIAVVVIVLLIIGVPKVIESLHTVSTDDAYVNGHVTFVAPRVGGQVAAVLVDDNNRVHKGDLLVQLDKAPYQIAVDIAQAGVAAANADLVAAFAQARAQTGLTRSLRFKLEHTIEEADNQVALLHSKVASLASEQATLDRTKAEYERIQALVNTQAVSQQDLDTYKEAYLVAKAKTDEALQNVYQIRVSLGLPAKPATGDDLTQVPADLDQTISSVREAQAAVIQSAAVLGYSDSFTKTPKQMVADFYKQDPEGDINRIYENLIKNAPAVKQAESKVLQAQRLLDQANLNLSYCDVVAEIDGVVTRRNVNPGNNVVTGENLMAVRSLSEIWIDANFKETQLADLRIGQPADLEVDTYGSKHTFKGRVTGFTMGTGSTLALLPAENATGNFVKVVQRLPVRIELTDYDPDKLALFTGLSVNATVDTSDTGTGDNAGSVLQPYLPSATKPTSNPAEPSSVAPLLNPAGEPMPSKPGSTTAPAIAPGQGR